jgi:EamA domain-containing membrane protein RarD
VKTIRSLEGYSLTITVGKGIPIWMTQEAMPQVRWIGFVITWVALVILTVDALRNRRNVSKSLVTNPD